MFSQLDSVEGRFLEIESRLADPELGNKPGEFRKLSQEHAQLQLIVDEYRIYKSMVQELASNKELIAEGDDDFIAMAKEEIKRLEPAILASTKRLQLLLLPKDPNDDKNILLEVRAGAGGDEAGL